MLGNAYYEFVDGEIQTSAKFVEGNFVRKVGGQMEWQYDRRMIVSFWNNNPAYGGGIL
jgi:hypothetical protein